MRAAGSLEFGSKMIKKNLKDAALKDRYKISKEEMKAIVKDIIYAVKSAWAGNPNIQKKEFMRILEAKDIKTFKDLIKKLDGGIGIVTDIYGNEDEVMKLFKKIAQFGKAKAHKPTPSKNKEPKQSSQLATNPTKSNDDMLNFIVAIPFITNMISSGID